MRALTSPRCCFSDILHLRRIIMCDKLGINNMNGITNDDDTTCGLNDMNCVSTEEDTTCGLNNMNCLPEDDEPTCSLNDMNCLGDEETKKD